ncbi:IucA/IucC family protein [Allostreptomyces psammosilenae]|uniref:Siderophore synthetase component n=1 Tax=Allostreptomyces psammosilenae TaxID=1892865 RepID=A0A852ZL16_9ACTN|nr:IucA/IucC family siderophore biosynthesis protein [Allostreptomyces psammosilenae]NYI03099.1 siderophore synthetase component [Allostreptomyces psammosilenae]
MTVPAHLTAEHFARASRALVAKAIAEFSYEELLTPTPDPDDPTGHLLQPAPGVSYRFRATRHAYGSWRVDRHSLRRHPEDSIDLATFLADTRDALGLDGDTAGHLYRELCNTLLADTRLVATTPPVQTLADLDYAELEGHQSGHPWLVANKGRLGFSAHDTDLWAPEARRPVRLPWIAVHRDLAEYRGTGPLADPATLLAGQLDPAVLQRFRSELTSRSLNPADYHWLPVHPWHWDTTVLPLFAADIAAGRIVPLGEAGDTWLPQQSIRTFLNTSRPDRLSVKLPLRILNTLVWRGLPTERTQAAPAVTAWIQGLCEGDPFLRDHCRVVLLGEVASVTVRHAHLESVPGVPYQYRELLGAIWREPVATRLDTTERARTLACLLQTDGAGRSLAAHLISRSGMTAGEWVRRLLGATLPPLLHFLYRYGVVFSPHGENAIVLFDEHDVPTRLAVKDFVDDVNISAKPLPELDDLPEEVAGVLLREEPDYLCQFLHAGFFVGVLRYLAPLLEEQHGLPEREFWSLVRAEITDHQARFPELADRFTTFDLLTPWIDRLCLNRNRLLLDGYRDSPTRPHVAAHGRVRNPLAPPGRGE